LTPPNNPSFERNTREFANELSKTLTGTISPVHLGCEFLRTKDKLEAIIEFVPTHEDPDLRYVQLKNGCWINILQRLVPNRDNPATVSTAKYSYTCSLGQDPDKHWLVRYDYEPGKHTYPASHVHINAENEDYNKFMEGTKYRPLSNLHFPTKRVSLEDFIEHLIVEFEVPLLHGKTKEEVFETLRRGRERFEDRRTK
jgi:hypothetical protein